MILHNKVCFQVLRSTFCFSRWSCVKFDKCPKMMSLDSASVGAEDYDFENEKNLGGWSWKEVSVPELCSPLFISAEG